MEPATPYLRSVITAAINCQLHPESAEPLPEEQGAVQETAERLLQQALAAGKIESAHVANLSSFSAGNSSMMVAKLATDLSFVVKIDRNPDVVKEADLLRRAGEDLTLPEATRNAFPRIYAVDRIGPIYGYLMEDLSNCTPLHETLAVTGMPEILELLRELWGSLLEPAYRATRSDRLIPNVAEDYFMRAQRRLSHAAAQGILPGPAEPLVFVYGDEVRGAPRGWGAELEWALGAIDRVAPTFGTFVHGDPNPENVLWIEVEGKPRFRLLDPKNWWVGDYLFDVAKLLHYARVTGPVEHLELHTRRIDGAAKTTIEFDRSPLTANQDLETDFLDVIGTFADSDAVGDNPGWRIRYRLAIAANLLSIVGPRMEKGQEDIALIALGEGLRELNVASTMLMEPF